MSESLAESIVRKIATNEHEMCWIHYDDAVIDGRYHLTPEEAAYLRALRGQEEDRS